MLASLRRLALFLWQLSKNSLKVSLYVVIVPLLIFILLAFTLRPFNLYLDLRDTIIEFGKATHLVIKKPNRLILKCGHSDSARGLQDVCEANRESGNYVGIWFAVMNPDSDVTYSGVKLVIQFDEPNTTKVNGQGDGWQMFKNGHFNFQFQDPIPQQFFLQTLQLRLHFPEAGEYPFRYFLYAEGYKRAAGSLLIRVK